MQVDHCQLIDAWESGVGRSLTERGLLLLALSAPGHEFAALAQWNVGARDALLLSLREQLFGRDLACLSECTGCGERLELGFSVNDVRAQSAHVGERYELTACEHRIRFRLPDSNDLAALEHATSIEAGARLLLQRCVDSAERAEASVEVAELPSAVVEAVSARMRELDGQAEVTIEVTCPACQRVEERAFDIVTHLWSELDAWARRVLQEVHVLASCYGWSEREILRLSAPRRRAYLELSGAAS